MADKEPRPVSHFRLKLGGKETVGVFKEVTGLDSETEIQEHKSTDANGNPYVRKVPGATKWSNITLKRGIDAQKGLWEWRNTVIKEGPDKARIEGTIELCDYDGKALVTYQFEQGWPSKYSGASLNASSNEIAMEELQICHEGLTRM
jgi:phage tail-like protein